MRVTCKTFCKKHINPKQFHKLFKTNKSNEVKSNLTIDDFTKHFKNISLNTASEFHDDSTVSNCLYDELDSDINAEEIRIAIKKLKTNKSCGEDSIVNELFIESVLMPHLQKLFNNIFHWGFYQNHGQKALSLQCIKKETQTMRITIMVYIYNLYIIIYARHKV
jgi:hypothetical protein